MRFWQHSTRTLPGHTGLGCAPGAPAGSRYTFSVQPHRETEIKLVVSDLKSILIKIRSLRARCLGRVFESNTLYDTPSLDLRRSNTLLRVRVETPAPLRSVRLGAGRCRATLTMKSPAPAGASAARFKIKLETEVAIDHPRRWIAQLHAIGLRAGFRYEKFRSTFVLPGLHLDLDETPVGIFLEIEGEPQAIDRAARALGFSRRDYLRSSYWDLYAADCRRRGVSPRHMIFRSRKLS
jgi:adenylate cyclase class 2